MDKDNSVELTMRAGGGVGRGVQRGGGRDWDNWSRIKIKKGFNKNKK